MANEGNLIPAKKGEVRNPKGRPVGSMNRSTIVKKWIEFQRAVNNEITGKTENLTVAEEITLQQIAKALKGDTMAFKELMDSAYGKNPDTLNVNEIEAKIPKAILPDGTEIEI